jgi:hypothetical protein
MRIDTINTKTGFKYTDNHLPVSSVVDPQNLRQEEEVRLRLSQAVSFDLLLLSARCNHT